MGIIGRIIRTLIEDNIREIVIEEYQGLTKKLRQVSPAGIDSNPLPEDQGAGFCVGDTTGKSVSVGVYCENNIAENGELRLFSRNDSAVEQGYVYIKKDGTLELNGNADNAVRYSILEIAFNQLKTEFNALVSTFTGHTHPIPLAQAIIASTIPNSSPPPTSGVPSTADITGSKVDEVKIP